MDDSDSPAPPASVSTDNNSSSTESPTPPANPPPGPVSSGNTTSNSTSTSPTPPASPPPSPPESPPPAPPHSSPPPPQQSSPPPPKQDNPPPSPPPPSSSSSSAPEGKPDSPPPSESSHSPPEQKSVPPPSPTSATPSPPGPPVPVSPPSNGSIAGPVFSPPPPLSGSPAASSSRPSPASRAPPHSNSSPGSSSAHNSPPPSNSLSSSQIGIIVGFAVVGVVIIAFITICLVCCKKKKKRAYYMDPPPHRPMDQYYNGSMKHQGPMGHVVKLSPSPGGAGGWGGTPGHPPGNASSEFNSGYSGQPYGHIPPPSPNMGMLSQGQFTYEELATATNGFSQANMLGQGGFGFVHKGVLLDKREVAVKSLKSGSGQGEREFQAEVEIISRVHHRHLVSLVGYCITERQRMLVYEYVPNKTLEYHLHGKGQPPMDWSTRLRIALGSAKGLAYLHEDCHPRIIHRDIKAANILLDANFEAMVADFGLAKLTTDNNTHVSTRVMGTFGYLAPEYAQSGKLTEKSDVFSFGVMLLELITGRRPVDTNNYMEDSLVDWARPLLTKALEDGNYDELADPLLEGNYIPHEMARMVACASAAIRHSARKRPRMSQIVRSLQGDSALEELNEGLKPQQSSVTNSTISGNIGYDTCAYNADMMKFRKMIMPTQEFTSGEYGATSESSDGHSGPQKHGQ